MTDPIFAITLECTMVHQWNDIDHAMEASSFKKNVKMGARMVGGMIVSAIKTTLRAIGGLFLRFGTFILNKIKEFRDRKKTKAAKEAAKAKGPTRTSEKGLYLNHCSSFTVYHEFGHYIANELGLHDDAVDYLYDQEWHFNYALREYMRPYSGTNPREFFADCFADYVTSITQRERLEELAPLTYWVLENMVFGDATLEDFWKMAVNYDGNDLVVVTVAFRPLERLPL